MRCFFGYGADGFIESVEVCSGGFPDTHDLRDEDSAHPVVRNLREHRASNDPHIVGFLAYDCACPRAARVCECPGVARDLHYVDVLQDVLIAKPVVQMFIDGAPQTDADVTLARNPGTVVRLQLRGAVPDGESVELRGNRLHVDFPTPVPMTFSGGQTAEATLVAPAQGLDGGLFVWGKWSRRLRLRVKGFAS